MRRGYKLLIAVVLSLLVAVPAAFAGISYNVEVYVNGEKVDFPDAKPFIDTAKARTYVPLRFVSEALGGKVAWDAQAKTAVVERNNVQVRMRIGSRVALRDGQDVALDAPAMISKARTMVPLRFVSEALGAKVVWNSGKVLITDDGASGGGNEVVDDLYFGDHNYYDGNVEVIDLKPGGGGKDTTPADNSIEDIPWAE
ncbi:MAG: copper amine oxidase N-terminal domain-containing protein [Peptococcaceae bacterium]|nr:copper amine oxidase N-terminal domain-containing protein [Peptococcaceae bacterium]